MSTEARERRRKALLANFYGTKSDVSGGEHASTRSNTNLDSPQFDAAAYCEELLANESLAALVSRGASLDRAITSIDAELKTLVYENYNKFINATDTIKQMRSNVENMQQEMSALESSMAALTERSERIDSELRPKRAAVQQLGTVHRLLQKVR